MKLIYFYTDSTGEDVERVIQIHNTGCGLACAAMITGSQYSEVLADYLAKKDMLGKRDKPHEEIHYYTFTKDILYLLELRGWTCNKRMTVFKDWSSLPDLCLVAINYHSDSNEWHWVVYSKDEQGRYVIDPTEDIKSERRYDFGRMNPKWYLPVFQNK